MTTYNLRAVASDELKWMVAILDANASEFIFFETRREAEREAEDYMNNGAKAVYVARVERQAP